MKYFVASIKEFNLFKHRQNDTNKNQRHITKRTQTQPTATIVIRIQGFHFKPWQVDLWWFKLTPFQLNSTHVVRWFKANYIFKVNGLIKTETPESFLESKEHVKEGTIHSTVWHKLLAILLMLWCRRCSIKKSIIQVI